MNAISFSGSSKIGIGFGFSKGCYRRKCLGVLLATLPLPVTLMPSGLGVSWGVCSAFVSVSRFQPLLLLSIPRF